MGEIHPIHRRNKHKSEFSKTRKKHGEMYCRKRKKNYQVWREEKIEVEEEKEVAMADAKRRERLGLYDGFFGGIWH